MLRLYVESNTLGEKVQNGTLFWRETDESIQENQLNKWEKENSDPDSVFKVPI